MMRSLFSAISGLRNHMSYMDVVGNNIANVNTVAFKSSRVTFQDILSQNIKGAGSPQDGGRGGTNPAQIGLGVNLGGIDNVMTQGSIQSTGKLTDFAIQGDGFFVVSDGQRDYYTRDGAFDIGVDGTIVNPSTGLRVMGWGVSGNPPQVDRTGGLRPVNVPFGQQIGANPTADDGTTPGVFLSGNLDAAAEVGSAATSTVTAYDALGNAHSILLTFEKTADNAWSVTPSWDDDGDPATPYVDLASGNIQFDGTDGSITSGGSLAINLASPPGGAAAVQFTLSFEPETGGLTQFAGDSQIRLLSNSGRAAGALVSFAVSPSGEVTGIYSNGQNQLLGQVAMASFVNPGGLLRSGQNLWETSANSGDALIGQPGSGSNGVINTGTLEGSNVDLAQQFTNMIMAQRGFQSSSRVITASDTMLQDLVNIIR